jgi:Ca2+:H+ antiporter
MGYLLIAVPIAIASSLLHASPAIQFIAAAIAIIPLAGVMGQATEQLAHRLGPGIGGLLNATFGNAAELILALFALFSDKDSVVKASLTGSIIGNLLLVLGASLLAGGIKFSVQKFNRTAAGAGSTLMVLATIGLIVPALFHNLVPNASGKLDHRVSVAVCVLLVFTYLLSLLFSLVTHRELLTGMKEEVAAAISEATWGLRHATAILLVATAFVAWMSEILVGAVDLAGEALGMNAVFMGVFVVAIVGNAAEHSTAIIMALKNQMDLAVGIALGSALQVALFVAPVLVFASYFRETPMDLLFTTLEVVAVILAVLVARMVAEDGESNWLEGAMLLMVYAILGVAFFFLPGEHEKPKAEESNKPAAIHSPR